MRGGGDDQDNPLANAIVEDTYVAFVDVLGFSDSVLGGFNETVQAYTELLEYWGFHNECADPVLLTIYSDTVLLRSPDLERLLVSVNAFYMTTALNSFLLRGGVARGRHVERQRGTNTYVVSEALTRAAQVEKTVRHPCVAVDRSVVIPQAWFEPDIPNINRLVLFFDGLTVVNPFGAFWNRSAGGRAQLLRERHPEHAAKYDWFLRLHEAVNGEAPLIPPTSGERGSDA